MKRKDLLQYPLVFFVGGIVVSVVGLMIMDITQVSATLNVPPTRVNVAQRANLPTRTIAPTLEPTDSPLPSVTAESTETPISTSEVISTSAFTSTVVPTLEATPIRGLIPSQSSTVTSTIRRATTSTLNSRVTATPTVDPRRGDSPFSAFDFTENWQTLNPNSIRWYKLGEKTSYPLGMQIWLDAYGRSGIEFSVFSPEQANDLNVATKPKGRGAHDKTTGHDLFWVGKSANAGIWYVLVKNTSSTPIQYQLNSSLSIFDHKNCFGYWEFDDKVWWSWCN